MGDKELRKEEGDGEKDGVFIPQPPKLSKIKVGEELDEGKKKV